MKPLEIILVGGPTLTFTKGAELFLWTPTRAVWPRDERPRRYGGRRAHHLSFPLKPRRHGPNAGKVCVHLTYEDGHHEDVAILDPADLAARFQHVQGAVLERFREEAGRVTPEEMIEYGMYVWLPKPTFRSFFDRLIATRRRRYRLREDFLDPFLAHVRRASPEVLHEPWVRDLDQVLFANFPDVPGQISLKYMPDWFDRGGPGWIAAPCPFFPDEFVPTLMARQFPGLYETFYWVARELQADVDREAIQRMAELSSHTI